MKNSLVPLFLLIGELSFAQMGKVMEVKSLNGCFQIKSELETSELKGSIRHIKTIGYSMEAGKKEKKVTWVFSTDYNKQGNIGTQERLLHYILQAKMRHEPDKAYSFKDTFEYDNSNRLVEERISVITPFSKTNRATYSYDSNGYLIGINDLGNYYPKLNSAITYNKVENWKSHDCYEDGRWQYRDTFKYDEKCRVIEYKFYGPDSGHNYRTTYEYSTKDSPVIVNEYLESGVLKRHYTELTTYEYDKKGNWISRTLKRNNEIVEVVKREIDYY